MFLVDASWLPRLQQLCVALYKVEKLARHWLKKKTQSNRSWAILSLDPTFTTMQHKIQNVTSCQASVPLSLIIRDVNPFNVSYSIPFDTGFTKKNKWSMFLRYAFAFRNQNLYDRKGSSWLLKACICQTLRSCSKLVFKPKMRSHGITMTSSAVDCPFTERDC